MIKEMLKKNIILASEVRDWKEAIKIAGIPLIKGGNIESRYLDKIIERVEELGFYIVLSKDIAMPHARPEEGVKKIGISMLKLDKGVEFGKENIKIVVVLAADSDSTHMNVISELATLFSDEEKIEKIKDAKNIVEILEVI